MTLSLSEMITKHGLKISGVIHVGAHYGQEYDQYKAAGVGDIVFIEPCTPAFEILESKFKNSPDVKLFKMACGDAKGQMDMNVEVKNDGQSNSLRKPKGHLDEYPDIKFPYHELVNVDRVDNLGLDKDNYNMLYMDVQGYEDMVIKGAPETLKYINTVYTEVSRAELYEGCPMIEDIDKLLPDFQRVETGWASNTWGDAIYKRVKPPTFISEPLQLNIHNKEVDHQSISLFNAISTAFFSGSLATRRIDISFENKGTFTYQDLLRHVATGLEYKIVQLKACSIDDSPISFSIPLKITVKQKSMTDIIPDQIYYLQEPAYLSDCSFKIDKFTEILIHNIQNGLKFGFQMFPEKRGNGK